MRNFKKSDFPGDLQPQLERNYSIVHQSIPPLLLHLQVPASRLPRRTTSSKETSTGLRGGVSPVHEEQKAFKKNQIRGKVLHKHIPRQPPQPIEFPISKLQEAFKGLATSPWMSINNFKLIANVSHTCLSLLNQFSDLLTKLVCRLQN